MIEGDTGASDLGLSMQDKEKLRETVNIVYHAAATVRFNETLRQVVNINVRGTKLMTLFAKEMKNLKVKKNDELLYFYFIL
jgi:fatty acyl-CoA reductase